MGNQRDKDKQDAKSNFTADAADPAQEKAGLGWGRASFPVFSDFGYQILLAQSVTTIHDGAGSRFPQGAVVDLDNNRFYIARQTSGEYQDQMIYEYDLRTEQLLRSKLVPIGKRVYLEGLVFFYNSSRQICFIVPVERYGKFGLFNFDTGQMETEFRMEGNFKIGVDSTLKYFLCGKNEDPAKDPNKNMNGVYLYHLHSVIAGEPKLAATVEFLHDQMFHHKIQGLTMIEDYILLGQGVEQQSVSVMDLNGNLIYMASFDSRELITLIGGNPSSSNLQVECEGISWIKENGITYPIVFNVSQGKANILKLGDTKFGTRISRQIYKGYNPLREHAALGLIESNGTPSVYVTAGEDFYEAVASISKKGIYTFFCNGSAVNAPIGGRSIRGTIFVTDLTSGGLASLAEIRGQDYGGIVWSNYYDTKASEVWKGWSNIGGAYAVQAGNSFDPLTANPGIYETRSATHAPTQDGAVKLYTITRGYSGRRQIQCHYSESGDIYYANLKADRELPRWRKVAFEA